VTPLRLLIIGAHPDDADYAAGGIASYYCAAGHKVRMVSLTNGDAGHHFISGPALAKRRWQEAQNAAAVIGATYEIFDNHDGELMPTLENRQRVVALIRNFKPDLVLTHRPNDYHPDHRYTSQLVQDAAYMVTVPFCVPSAPFLTKDPVIAYLPDFFQKPTVFEPTVAIDVGPVVDKIVSMLHSHTSQFYEWLPFNQGEADYVPGDEPGRRAWLREWFVLKLRKQADLYRDLLVKLYGKERGTKIEFAEGFEGCEYGARLDESAQRRLFPFLSSSSLETGPVSR
jgi:N-acetylglucosamine malate deacetylase 1